VCCWGWYIVCITHILYCVIVIAHRCMHPAPVLMLFHQPCARRPSLLPSLSCAAPCLPFPCLQARWFDPPDVWRQLLRHLLSDPACREVFLSSSPAPAAAPAELTMPAHVAAALDVEPAAQLCSSSPASAAAPAELTMPAQSAAAFRFTACSPAQQQQLCSRSSACSAHHASTGGSRFGCRGCSSAQQQPCTRSSTC
jgi:hypothetical protein